jgi:lipoprotein-anchoring transpeptidase ErfK/SrfK
MVIRPLPLVVVLTMIGTALASTAAANAGSPDGTAPRGDQLLLVLHRPAVARAQPTAASPLVRVVAARTALTGSSTVLPIVQTATGPAGSRWLRVRLPMRPNGSTGWVRASIGSLAATGWEIVIHRAQRRAVVLEDARARASFPVVVGKPSTPTPLGTYFVVEKLHVAPGVAEGPWVLATSAYSDVLEEYAGGDGQVALHGTVGFTDPLGTFASHGCIRFAPAAIDWIAQHVERGSIVVVER